jgi:chromosome segregation ATPase
LIEKLREQIIDQIKIRDKLRHDLEQLQNTYKTDIREREQIEGFLHRDLTAVKDEIRKWRTPSEQCLHPSSLVALQSVRSEYQHVLSVKDDLEKQLAECQNELNTSKAVAHSLTNQLKEQVEQLSREKVISSLFGDESMNLAF